MLIVGKLILFSRRRGGERERRGEVRKLCKTIYREVTLPCTSPSLPPSLPPSSPSLSLSLSFLPSLYLLPCSLPLSSLSLLPSILCSLPPSPPPPPPPFPPLPPLPPSLPPSLSLLHTYKAKMAPSATVVTGHSLLLNLLLSWNLEQLSFPVLWMGGERGRDVEGIGRR